MATFDTYRYQESIEEVLDEFLGVYFPSTNYIVTFQAPGDPVKPTFWLQVAPGRNRETRTWDQQGKQVQGKEVTFLVSALATDRPDAVQMSDRLTRAMLASSSVLGGKGLRYAEISPFQDVTVETQKRQFRRTASLTFTVEIRA